MTLRKKTLLISGAVTCCLIIILLITMNTILLQGFRTLEKQDMEKNLLRAQNVLQMEQAALDTMASDWAFWDDSYEFVQDNNEEYIRKNLNDLTFITQKLNFILYVNSVGQMVYGQGFDLEKETTSPLPVGLVEQITSQQLLPYSKEAVDGVSGIVTVQNRPVMLAIRPILDTDKEKPARGGMIVGRFLTSENIADLANTAQLSLRSCLFTEAELPEDFGVAKAAFTVDSSIVIQPLDDNHIAGYIVLPDLYKQPGLILRVDTMRDIYNQGKRTLSYATFMLIIMGILFGGIHWLFLEKTVLARLTSLSRQVMGIGKSGDYMALVDEQGDDELGMLAGNINKMLKSLAVTQNELRTSEVITRVLLNGIPDSLLRIDQHGLILDLQTGRCRLMATAPQMMSGRNISECYPSHVAKIFMWKIQVAINSNTQQVFEYESSESTNTTKIIYQEIRIDPCGEQEVIAIIRDFEKII